jgi:hypothetical protein
MELVVTIHAKNSGGDQFEITLQKTAVDQGVIRLRSWRAGENPAADLPAKDQSVNVYNIRSLSFTEITCRSHVFIGLDPVFACGPVHATAPVVQLTVTGTPLGHFDGTTSCPVTGDDFTKLKKFLFEAAFPSAG